MLVDDPVRLGDLDVDQAGVGEVARVLVMGEGAGDAADVLLHIGAGGVVHVGVSDDVADGKSAAGLEHAGGFAPAYRPAPNRSACSSVISPPPDGGAAAGLHGRVIDWDLPDPKGRSVDEVRATRDDIARRVDALLLELDG